MDAADRDVLADMLADWLHEWSLTTWTYQAVRALLDDLEAAGFVVDRVPQPEAVEECS